MVGRPVRFRQVGRAIFADCEQTICQIASLIAPQAFQTLPHSVGDGGGQALAGKRGQFAREQVGLLILNVETYADSTMLDRSFYHGRQSGVRTCALINQKAEPST